MADNCSKPVDLEDEIVEAATGVKRATFDGNSAEAVSVDDVIKAADRQATQNRKGCGLKFSRIRTQGTA